MGKLRLREGKGLDQGGRAWTRTHVSWPNSRMLQNNCIMVIAHSYKHKKNQVELLPRGHLNKSGYVYWTSPRVETSEQTLILGQGQPLQGITIQMLLGCATSLWLNNNSVNENSSHVLSINPASGALQPLLLRSLDKRFSTLAAH